MEYIKWNKRKIIIFNWNSFKSNNICWAHLFSSMHIQLLNSNAKNNNNNKCTKSQRARALSRTFFLSYFIFTLLFFRFALLRFTYVLFHPFFFRSFLLCWSSGFVWMSLHFSCYFAVFHIFFSVSFHVYERQMNCARAHTLHEVHGECSRHKRRCAYIFSLCVYISQQRQTNVQCVQHIVQIKLNGKTSWIECKRDSLHIARIKFSMIIIYVAATTAAVASLLLSLPDETTLQCLCQLTWGTLNFDTYTFFVSLFLSLCLPFFLYLHTPFSPPRVRFFSSFFSGSGPLTPVLSLFLFLFIVYLYLLLFITLFYHYYDKCMYWIIVESYCRSLAFV